MTFGEKVRYVRLNILPGVLHEEHISTERLGGLLGINQSHVSKVENDPVRRFGRKVITKLSEISKVPFDFFNDDNIKSISEVSKTKDLYEALGDDIEFVAVRDVSREYKMSAEDVIGLIRAVGALKK